MSAVLEEDPLYGHAGSDALADRTLIANNFKRLPAVHVKSLDMAEADQKRAAEDAAALPDNRTFFNPGATTQDRV